MRPSALWTGSITLVVLLSTAPSICASESQLEKGARDDGGFVGVGFAHDLWGGASGREFLSIGGRYGRILTHARGPGFLRGHFALNAEVAPLFLMFQESTVYGFNGVMMARYYLATDSRLTPFVSFGLGILVSTDKIPENTARLNFTPQIGAGVSIAAGNGRMVTLEYRLHHLSNAELVLPNPGVNSSYFQIGVSVELKR